MTRSHPRPTESEFAWVGSSTNIFLEAPQGDSDAPWGLRTLPFPSGLPWTSDSPPRFSPNRQGSFKDADAGTPQQRFCCNWSGMQPEYRDFFFFKVPSWLTCSQFESHWRCTFTFKHQKLTRPHSVLRAECWADQPLQLGRVRNFKSGTPPQTTESESPGCGPGICILKPPPCSTFAC